MVQELTPEELHELLEVDYATGRLWWKPRSERWFTSTKNAKMWNKRFAGSEAFITRLNSGYRQAKINGLFYIGHRVIFAMYHGRWPDPDKLLDHINRDRSDDRIVNLREVTVHQNRWNAAPVRKNRSGYVGVYANNGGKSWTASVNHYGKHHYVGSFRCPTAAAIARDLKALELKGEFAYLNVT